MGRPLLTLREGPTPEKDFYTSSYRYVRDRMH